MQLLSIGALRLLRCTSVHHIDRQLILVGHPWRINTLATIDCDCPVPMCGSIIQLPRKSITPALTGWYPCDLPCIPGRLCWCCFSQQMYVRALCLCVHVPCLVRASECALCVCVGGNFGGMLAHSWRRLRFARLCFFCYLACCLSVSQLLAPVALFWAGRQPASAAPCSPCLMLQGW